MFIVNNELTITWILTPTDSPLAASAYDIKFVPSGLDGTYTDAAVVNYKAPTSICAGSIQYLWTPPQAGRYQVFLTTGDADSYLILDKKDFWVFLEPPISQDATKVRGARSIPPPPPEGIVDFPFSEVSLLIPANGADGGGATEDFSQEDHPLTFVGTIELDTAAAKFGTSSLLSAFGYLQTFHTTADFTLADNDFTAETHIRFITLPSGSSQSGSAYLAHWRTATNNRSWYVTFTTTDELEFSWSTDGLDKTTIISTDMPALSTNVWYHVALCRTGSTIRMFLDGVELTTSGPSIGSTVIFNPNTLTLFRVGSTDAPNGFRRFIHGWLDNVRLINGTGRYISDFTPPTEEYPTS